MRFACALPAVLVAGTIARTSGATEAPAPGTFEALVAASSGTVDLATLIAPFITLEECKRSERALDAARCHGMGRFLRSEVPRRSYRMIVDDAAAVEVSDYDARIKGYHLKVLGCLACDTPVGAGDPAARRLVTLRIPDKRGGGLASAVAVAEAALKFEDIPQARAWAAAVKSRLRIEVVFQPEDRPWTFGPSKGYAFKMLGVRVFDRCTGEVVYSNPASGTGAEKYASGAECQDAEAVAEGKTGQPPRLSLGDINESMGRVRPAVDACLASYKGLRGAAELHMEIAGPTGVPLSVRLHGSLGGTALGECLTGAARKARFGTFAADTQKFTYPVRLEPRR